jgi:uncharacterized protein YjbI with pentapeptide repeats
MQSVVSNPVDCAMSGQLPYNCAGCDLTDRNLAGKDLTGANLTKATLVGANFQGVLGLAGANLSDATIGVGTSFAGCDLSTAVFDIATSIAAALTDPNSPPTGTLVSFAGATVPFQSLGMTWNRLDLTNVTIPDLPQDLSGLQVTLCDLTGFDFSGRTVKNARFFSTVLRKANFGNKAVLDNIVFAPAPNGPRTDLTQASFASARILGQGVFDDTTLTQTDFSDAVLSLSTFQFAQMDGTIFDGVDLTECIFSMPPYWAQSPTPRTSFKQATLNASLLQKDWSCLDLTNATLVGLDTKQLASLDASNAVLLGLDLSNGVLNRANFTGATLGQAPNQATTSFQHSQMSNCIFDGATGPYVNFEKATLTESSFHGVSLPYTDMTNADLRGCNLSQSNFSNAKFSKAWLQGDGQFKAAVLTDSQLPNTAFDGANLTRVQFTSSYVWGGATTFEGATVVNANFTNAYMTGVNFTNIAQKAAEGVKFVGACLVNAIFNGSDFRSDDGNNASFVNACLHGANFTDASLSGADLTGAAIAIGPGWTFPARFPVTLEVGWPPQKLSTTISLSTPTVGIQAATTSLTDCPDGTNGPCTIPQQLTSTAPTSWPMPTAQPAEQGEEFVKQG